MILFNYASLGTALKRLQDSLWYFEAEWWISMLAVGNGAIGIG